MPARIMLVTTDTQPRPAGRWRTRTLAKLISFLAIPASTIRVPANTKKGTAKKEKDCVWVKNFWAATDKLVPLVRRYQIDAVPIEKAMGTPMQISAKNISAIIRIKVISQHPPCRSLQSLSSHT